ncbi:MAG: hypothetical protein II452_00470 [Paludibacteraceae bacterium]|nr:hypothetical protein [Paludibacteraceae bacterium]
MKQIALKPISIQLPKTADPETARALQKMEEALRENNALIEYAINDIIKEITNNG